MRSVWLVIIICCAACASVVETVYVDKGNPQPIVLTVNMARDTTVAAPSGINAEDVKEMLDERQEQAMFRAQMLDQFLGAMGVILAALAIMIVIAGFFGYNNLKDIRQFKEELSLHMNKVKIEWEKSKAEYDIIISGIHEQTRRLSGHIIDANYQIEDFAKKKIPLDASIEDDFREYLINTNILRFFNSDIPAEIYEKRWIASMALGKYKTALSDAEKFLEIYPERIDWYLKGVRSAWWAGDTSAMHCLLHRATQYRHSSSELWVYRGAMYHATQKFEEAIECYNKAIELDPQDINAWEFRANSFARLGQKQQMLDDLIKAFGLNPLHKKKARKNLDLKAYWDDPDFIALTKDDEEEESKE